LNDYIATREELLDRAHDVFTWVREGKLNIKIDKVFDLDQVQTAHSYLESGQAKGKVLLKL
jgi:NADPH2:quinone reductase